MGSVLRADVRQADLLHVIHAASRGDQAAIAELVNHCLPQVSAYLGRRGAAEPDALANTVMAEFVGNLPRLEFNNHKQFWSYLYSVCRSRLLDEKRRTKVEHTTEWVEGIDPSSRFEDGVVQEMWMADLLSELTEDQRQVVELRFKDDLTLEETARRVGKTLTAVKGLQRRALAALATAVAVILLVVLAVRWFDDVGLNVQSQEPADRSQPNVPLETERNSGVSGLAEVETEDLTGSGVGAVGANVPNRQTSERPVEIDVNEPVVVGPGLSGPVIPEQSVPNAPVTTVAGTETTVGASPTSTPGVSSTSTAPSTTSIPATTTTTIAYVPAPPNVPLFLAPDVVNLDAHAGQSASVILDVLDNDEDFVNPASLRVLVQPALGLVELEPPAEAVETPTLRFYPAGPGNDVFVYQACGPLGCQTTTVTVAVTWYNAAACSGLTPTVIGTPGNDVLIGTAGPDVIFGYDGDDEIRGGGGDDIICGGAGDDVIDGDDGGDVIYGGPGIDDVVGGNGNDRIYGGEDNDYLDGDAGEDVLFGGEGRDSITGGAQDDRLYGESGNDELYGDSSDDLLFGGIGHDVLYGFRGADLLYGGSGADTLDAGTGKTTSIDRLYGGQGPDTLTGSLPEDRLDGQDGADTCNLGVLTNCE